MAEQFQGDLWNWELINHEILSGDDDDDFDGIYAEVLSLYSFPSSSTSDDDDGTLRNGRSRLDLHDFLKSPTDCVDQNESDINLSGSLLVEQNSDANIEEALHGSLGVVDHDDDGGNVHHHVVNFFGPVDLGKNPVLERETLHQFIDEAIDAMQNGENFQNGFHGSCDYYGDDHDHHEACYNDDDDDDEQEIMDLDDELVPWGVADRLGRQRMRKLGKRCFARMTKSKQMAHIYTMRGCVRGKHGLGLKAC
ncbi:hypothetical protein Dimus_026027 [Dionaea muscipula]